MEIFPHYKRMKVIGWIWIFLSSILILADLFNKLGISPELKLYSIFSMLDDVTSEDYLNIMAYLIFWSLMLIPGITCLYLSFLVSDKIDASRRTKLINLNLGTGDKPPISESALVYIIFVLSIFFVIIVAVFDILVNIDFLIAWIRKVRSWNLIWIIALFSGANFLMNNITKSKKQSMEEYNSHRRCN